MRFTHGPGIVLALCLVACAQPEGPQADWAHGARRARVIGAADAALVKSELPACLGALGPDLLAGRRFVRVRFWNGHRSVTDVAEVPAGLTLHERDEVELWPEACADGRPARISRMLAAHRD